MTKAQTDAALAQLELLRAVITEIGERIDADLFDDEVRDELATDVLYGATSLADLAAAVAA